VVISPYRALVVDDFEPWRKFVCSALKHHLHSWFVSEAGDGPTAVQMAKALQPHLILLDIGLPGLNGIEAAYRIRALSPQSKIIFVSEQRDPDIADAALGTGARGYVVKSDAGGELLAAVNAVLDGKRFVSARLEGRGAAIYATNERSGRHEVGFYANDASLVDGFARFIETALESGSRVTFIATELHRNSVLQRLKSDAVNIDWLIEQRRYASLDVVEALGTVMGSDGLPDPVLCAKVLGDLVADSTRTGQHRVSACGEFAPLLLKGGRVQAAIQMEHLTDEFARTHDIDIFCGYLSSFFPPKESSLILQRVCAEHTAVWGRELC
jgi:DNA-binding NarL/FixJ family response regulator